MSYKKIVKDIQEKFELLKFDQEQHAYTVRGKKLPSVSGLIKEFSNPFNAKQIAPLTAKKTNRTTEEVLQEWDDIRNEACRLGTRVHDFGERYIIDKYKLETDLKFYDVYQHLKPGEELLPKEKAILKFWEKKPPHYVPLLMELRMYSEELGYAGTADIILLDTRDMSLVIADYKTNKDLFKQYKNQKLRGRFDYLDDMPISKYKLQLSYYQILLEQTGYKVSRRFLVWLREDGEYEIFDTPDLTGELKEHLKQNKIDASW